MAAKRLLLPADDLLVCSGCLTLYSKSGAEKDEKFHGRAWGKPILLCPGCGEQLEVPKIVEPS